MRKLAKRWLTRQGYEIVRKVDRSGKAIDVLDLVVRSLLENKSDVRVLQIGANDGIGADPIRPIIKKYDLPALLVEPLPDIFRSLENNYRDSPRVVLENCAISTQDGQQTMYRIVQKPGAPGWVTGLAGFDAQVLLKHKNQFPGIASCMETVSVRTMTIRSLLDKHHFEPVEILQIDTEGYDWEVLKMCLDSDVIPAVVNYEYIHLSLESQAECRKRLSTLGYTFLNIGKDTLAVRGLCA